MSNKRDYYEVLGVSKTADDAEIKSLSSSGHGISPGSQAG